MAITHHITLVCDSCKKQSTNAYGWAAVNVGGSDGNISFMPDQKYAFCPDCWRNMRRSVLKVA